MPFSKDIVNIIDTKITADFKRAAFQPSRVCGLLEVNHNKVNGQLISAPIFGNSRVVYDDRYNFQTYHRITGDKQYSKSEFSTGRGESMLIERVPMCMVVIAQRSKLQLTSEQLEQAIVKHLVYRLDPTELTTLHLKNCDVMVQSTDFNSYNVFNQEYTGVDTFLIDNLIYFKINYTIESTFGKGCFNTNTIDCG